MKISRNKQTMPVQSAPMQSSDIYNDILLPLNKRARDSGSLVFFYRIIGFDNQAEFIGQTAALHERLLELDSLYLYFIENIPLPFNKNLTDKINNALCKSHNLQTNLKSINSNDYD
ncbi:hypothetical protein [Desulfoscipio gibsoniae]|uniref:Uncharacterized protein n=1 Tax=Desulfoscipio gibsoniae DSM 7213 TaxID=767817 RepID=R4KRD3_9FIRM|nr:hypothetical protein [Desulfoscipio gibsoniae]AGL03130.1 hypothetical protein Desgi_3811 [Desulfoscipio gibsoniae DSM 7213]